MKWLMVIFILFLSGCYQVVDGETPETSEPTEAEIDGTVTDFLGTFDDIGCEDEEDHEHFTGVDAVSIALEKYGTSDDYVYLYEPEPIHYGGGIGYNVAIKSKKLAELGGDGIVVTLFVSDSGEVYEN